MSRCYYLELEVVYRAINKFLLGENLKTLKIYHNREN